MYGGVCRQESVISKAGEISKVTARDGLQLTIETYGSPEQQPVIFLHGGGQSRYAWRRAARLLGTAGYRSCAVDMRGHGDSDWSDSLAYRFDDFTLDLVTVIDTLSDQPAVLVGASLGGHIAMLTAANFRTRAKALALADVTPWIDEAVETTMRLTLREAEHGFATIEEAASLISRLNGSEPGGKPPAGLYRHLQHKSDGRLYFRWDTRLMDETVLHGGGPVSSEVRI